MSREHPYEYDCSVIFEAQDLYCVDRLTFKDVAKRMGVAVTTVRRWADRYNWEEKRESIARAESEIKANTVMARSKMIEKLIEDGTPQAAFAVASLEQLALAQAKAAKDGQIMALQKAPATIRTPKEAVLALQQAIEKALNQLLSNPEQLDLKRVKELKESMGLVAKMKQEMEDREAVGGADERPGSGFSDEMEAKIRAILGGE